MPNDRAWGPELDRLFLDIYRQEAGYVSQQLRRLGVRPADLPDITHDVFMIVRRRLVDFDQTRPVRPWLFGILFRAAADCLRRPHRRHEVGPDKTGIAVDGEDPGPRPDEALIQRQARDILSDILHSLDPRLRVVLELHDFGEVPAVDVANQLGIPLKTVYTRLRLARARIDGAGAGRRDPRRIPASPRRLASNA
jgi:RNA polymerase sigma-70 factor, ECF subfamily